MDRVAVFVDAGNLFAQGAIEMFGERMRRWEITLDHGAVAAGLKQFALTSSRI